MGQDRGERTRAAVVATARRHFAEHGYEGATGARIAAEVGVSEPNISFHFGSKAGLLVAVIRDYYDELLARMQQLLEGEAEPVARLRAFGRWWVAHNAEHIELLAVFGRQGRAGAGGEVVEAFLESNRRVTRAFDGLVDDVRSAGLLRDGVATRTVRDAFFGAAEHLMLGRAMTGRPADLRRASDDVLDLLLHGALASPGPAGSAGSAGPTVSA